MLTQLSLCISPAAVEAFIISHFTWKHKSNQNNMNIFNTRRDFISHHWFYFIFLSFIWTHWISRQTTGLSNNNNKLHVEHQFRLWMDIKTENHRKRRRRRGHIVLPSWYIQYTASLNGGKLIFTCLLIECSKTLMSQWSDSLYRQYANTSTW